MSINCLINKILKSKFAWVLFKKILNTEVKIESFLLGL